MTQEDIDILESAEFGELVRENLGRAPLSVAADKRLPHAGLLATQVKNLNRARIKLPSFFDAGCIIPTLSYEQSSSEEVAANRGFAGELCIDLTCGLGADSFALSRSFRRVISIEPNASLARIARINFGRLGADNIDVVCMTAEQFMAGYEGIRADLIFADPDRRGSDGRKKILLQDCSPDISAMLPVLKKKGALLAVKLSPMFDIWEIFRVFGAGCRVRVISSDDQCREVMAMCGEGYGESKIEVQSLRYGRFGATPEEAISAKCVYREPSQGDYLIVPDPALLKSGIAPAYYASQGTAMTARSGYALSRDAEQAHFGRLFEITLCRPWQPKALKRLLKERGIRSLNIMKRETPLSNPAIAAALGITEGGKQFGVVTVSGKATWFMLVEPVDV